MNYKQKIIFTTLLDYYRAGIVDPYLENNKYLLLKCFKFDLKRIQETKIEEDKIKKKYFSKIEDVINTNGKNLNNTDSIQNPILKAEKLSYLSNDIVSLEQSINSFEEFYSLRGSNQLLFGKGNPNSKFLFISEPPSYREQLEGKPYVDSCEELFDKIIKAMGLISLKENECNIYVIPSLPFKPIKNNTNKTSDLELMKPFLKRYIEILSPSYLVLISKIPSTILGINDFLRIGDTDGYVGRYLGIPTIEIEGMKSMVDNQNKKRKTWNNIKLLMKVVEQKNG